MNQTPENNKQRDVASKRKVHKKSAFRDMIITIVIAVAVALLLRSFVIDPYTVDGTSMLPTLNDGEHVIVNKFIYAFSEPQRGDVIFCRYPRRTQKFVKRVVGLPGEKVSVHDGFLYIDDVKIVEDYIKDQMTYEMDDYIVPENSVFVLGDNRNDSMDSHFIDEVGPIYYHEIIGKGLLIIWPLDRFGAPFH